MASDDAIIAEEQQDGVGDAGNLGETDSHVRMYLRCEALSRTRGRCHGGLSSAS